METAKTAMQRAKRGSWLVAGLAGLCLLMGASTVSAHPRVSVGIGIGIPPVSIGIGIGAPGYPPGYAYGYAPGYAYGYYPPCAPPVVYAPVRRGPRAAWARGHWQWTRDGWGRKVRVWAPPRAAW